VVDNFHNSKPEAIYRIEKLALEALPADASEQDKADCKVDLVRADLRDRDAIDAVFANRAADDRIYAVILIGALKAVGESSQIPIECVGAAAAR